MAKTNKIEVGEASEQTRDEIKVDKKRKEKRNQVDKIWKVRVKIFE